jgi:hypothetical protein
MVMARRPVDPLGLLTWDDAPLVFNDVQLPKLDDVHCGIYLREGYTRDVLEQLADLLAQMLGPAGGVTTANSDDYAMDQVRAENSAA